jgi:hypothetical protein
MVNLKQQALMLMHNCLADASPEFVTFCIAQLQFMAAIGNTGELHMIVYMHYGRDSDQTPPV